MTMLSGPCVSWVRRRSIPRLGLEEFFLGEGVGWWKGGGGHGLGFRSSVGVWVVEGGWFEGAGMAIGRCCGFRGREWGGLVGGIGRRLERGGGVYGLWRGVCALVIGVGCHMLGIHGGCDGD